MKRQVQTAVAVALASVLLGGWWAARSTPVTGMAGAGLGVLGVLAYGWWALRRGRHTAWDLARGRIAPGHAVVLWKPGCPYCERLLRALSGDDRVTWVNVWHDDRARSVVCELNGGDEYVPTVLIGPAVLRNPTSQEVVAALR